MLFLFVGSWFCTPSYSYAKLSVAYPSKGGTVIFIDKALGIDFFTGSANNLLWIGYIVTLALYAVAFGNYAATFLPETLQGAVIKHVLISGGILLPTLLNLLGNSLISKTETYVVAIKIAILVLVILAGLGSIDATRLAPSTWKPIFHVIGGGMIIFVAYEGFELIANTAPNVHSYKVTLPLAYYVSVIFVIVLYIFVALVTVGSIAPDLIASAQDFALAKQPNLRLASSDLPL